MIFASDHLQEFGRFVHIVSDKTANTARPYMSYCGQTMKPDSIIKDGQFSIENLCENCTSVYNVRLSTPRRYFFQLAASECYHITTEVYGRRALSFCNRGTIRENVVLAAVPGAVFCADCSEFFVARLAIPPKFRQRDQVVFRLPTGKSWGAAAETLDQKFKQIKNPVTIRSVVFNRVERNYDVTVFQLPTVLIDEKFFEFAGGLRDADKANIRKM